ncbi:hypothetical protein B0J13DRAFT_647984 [Dactylonectria estremocensis]|uniref:RRM domain-containing protein n=1 Tax=Dactylonectria estremocensis TaxID=1079267 RepID=A0A9P9DQL2_9HYPO|nr:hypothetical protein B0J13DRAFT_647984 [Dactylonectria estremocensis]
MAIGKRITLHESTRYKKRNDYYCFVDFETVEEADAAVLALNGKWTPTGVLRASRADKNRRDLDAGRLEEESVHMFSNDAPQTQSSQSRRSQPHSSQPQSSRAMESNNWRRGN